MYMVVKRQTISELEEAVELLMGCGWKLAGGICVCVGAGYLQAMMR